jgi:hypothetical protein
MKVKSWRKSESLMSAPGRPLFSLTSWQVSEKKFEELGWRIEELKKK